MYPRKLFQSTIVLNQSANQNLLHISSVCISLAKPSIVRGSGSVGCRTLLVLRTLWLGSSWHLKRGLLNTDGIVCVHLCLFFYNENGYISKYLTREYYGVFYHDWGNYGRGKIWRN